MIILFWLETSPVDQQAAIRLMSLVQGDALLLQTIDPGDTELVLVHNKHVLTASYTSPVARQTQRASPEQCKNQPGGWQGSMPSCRLHLRQV